MCCSDGVDNIFVYRTSSPTLIGFIFDNYQNQVQGWLLSSTLIGLITSTWLPCSTIVEHSFS